MDVMVRLPGEFAARFGSEAERDRHVLEVLVLDEYRAGRIGAGELGRVLGFGSEAEVDGFLAARSPGRRMGEAVVPGPDDLVERFKAFAAAHTLGGLSVTELIREGRR